MSEAYSRKYQPSMPALRIQLHSAEASRTTDSLIALVDTGADATIVPRRYLVEVGAQETAPGWLRGITGERRPVALYFVDIRLDRITFPGVRVVADDLAAEILLGRDILNKLPLFLDGPQQQTDLLDDATANRLRERRRQA